MFLYQRFLVALHILLTNISKYHTTNVRHAEIQGGLIGFALLHAILVVEDLTYIMNVSVQMESEVRNVTFP